MTAPQSTLAYNADEKQAERAKQIVTVGGREFKPRPRTVNMMKGLAEIAPEAFGAKELDRIKNPTRELELVNTQINAMLIDAEGNEPGQEFLDEHLDLVDGYELLEKLTPSSVSEVERAGN